MKSYTRKIKSQKIKYNNEDVVLSAVFRVENIMNSGNLIMRIVRSPESTRDAVEEETEDLRP